MPRKGEFDRWSEVIAFVETRPLCRDTDEVQRRRFLS